MRGSACRRRGGKRGGTNRTGSAYSAMVDDAHRFRKQAEECRQQAVKAVGSLEKAQWLRLSEEWLKLAQSAEARHYCQ
jgi:hypothetical protein